MNPARLLTGQLSVFLFYLVLAGLTGLFLAVFFSGKAGIWWAGCYMLAFLLGLALSRSASAWPSVAGPDGIQLLTTLDGVSLEGMGRITAISQDKENQEYILTLQDVTLTGDYTGEIAGISLIYEVGKQEQTYSWQLGQWVSFRGTFSLYTQATNPGAFDYRSYQFSIGILGKIDTTYWLITPLKDGSRFLTALYNLRQWMGNTIRSLAEEEDRGILVCILTGDRSGLSDTWKSLYQEGGIFHLLAVSGLHISIIGMALYRLMRKLVGDYVISSSVAGIVTLCFCLMVGNGSSVVRATVCFLLHLGADWLGRRADLATSVSVAGILLLSEHPLLLFQSGFLMSFSCMFGIAFFVPTVNWMYEIPGKNIYWKEAPKAYAVSTNKQVRTRAQRILMALLQAVFMQVSSLVWVLWFQGKTSLLYPFVNMLALPLMGYVLFSDLFAVVLGSVLPFLGIATLGPAHYILRLYAWLCERTSENQACTIVTGRPAVWQILLWGCALGGYWLYCRYMIYHKRKLVPYLAGLLILPCSILLMMRIPDGAFHITFLDVGQGDGIVMELPDGQGLFCVDGGSSSNQKLTEYVYTPYLSYLGARKVEYWVITHPDSDHYSGLMGLLELGYPVNHIYMPVAFRGSDFARTLETLHSVEYIAAGSMWQFGEISIEALHPSSDYVTNDENDASCVLLVKDGDFTALLTGDLEVEGESKVMEALKRRGINALSVLKLGHHGSKTSSSGDFLQQTAPELGIISAGKKNRYGHPHKEVLERLSGLGIYWKNTAYTGAVSVKTDGERLFVTDYLQN